LILFELFTGVQSERYLKRYLKFIQHYSDMTFESTVTEKHHVLPKDMFQEYSKEPWNLVDLPLRVHFLAHWMLAKALQGKMWYAFYAMCNKNTKNGKLKSYNSVMYETAKKKFSECHSQWHNSLTDGIQNKKIIGAKTKKLN